MNEPEYTPLSPHDAELVFCAAPLPVAGVDPTDESLVLYVLGALDAPAEAEILAAAREAGVRRRLVDVNSEVEALLSRSPEDLSSDDSDIARLLATHAVAALNVGVRLPVNEPNWCAFPQSDPGLPESLALLAALVSVEKLESNSFGVGHRSAQPIWNEEPEWRVDARIDEIGSLVVDVRFRGSRPSGTKRLRLVLRHGGVRLPLGIADIQDGQAQLRAVGVAGLLGMKRGPVDPESILVQPCENQTTTRVLYTNEQEQEISPFAVMVSEPIISKGLFEISLRPTDLTPGAIVEVAIPVSHRGCWQRIATGKWDGGGPINLLSKLPWEHEEGVYAGVVRLRRLSG